MFASAAYQGRVLSALYTISLANNAIHTTFQLIKITELKAPAFYEIYSIVPKVCQYFKRNFNLNQESKTSFLQQSRDLSQVYAIFFLQTDNYCYFTNILFINITHLELLYLCKNLQ